MENKMMAAINWLPPSEGGRKKVPFGAKYGPIIKTRNRFGQQNDSWSVVIVNEEFLSDFETVAQISFLVKDGFRELRKDTEFDLFEGNRLVATGRIIK